MSANIFLGAKHFGSKPLVLINKLSAEMLRPSTHRDEPNIKSALYEFLARVFWECDGVCPASLGLTQQMSTWASKLPYPPMFDRPF